MGTGGADVADTEALGHHRMVVDHFLGVLGGIGIVGLVVVVLHATGDKGLGEVHAGGTLSGAAVFSGDVPRKGGIGGREVFDGHIVGFQAGSAVVGGVGGLAIFQHERNAAEEFGQTQVGQAAEELGLTRHAGFRLVAGPVDLVHLEEGKVRVGDHLVELVPKALGKGGGGGPGGGEVAHVLVGAELVLVVHHVRTGEGVVAETLAHGAREVEFLELEVAGQERIDHLVGGVVGVGDGELGLRLLFEEGIVRFAGNSGHAAQNGTDDIFVCFHDILCD